MALIAEAACIGRVGNRGAFGEHRLRAEHAQLDEVGDRRDAHRSMEDANEVEGRHSAEGCYVIELHTIGQTRSHVLVGNRDDACICRRAFRSPVGGNAETTELAKRGDEERFRVHGGSFSHQRHLGLAECSAESFVVDHRSAEGKDAAERASQLLHRLDGGIDHSIRISLFVAWDRGVHFTRREGEDASRPGHPFSPARADDARSLFDDADGERVMEMGRKSSREVNGAQRVEAAERKLDVAEFRRWHRGMRRHMSIRHR